MARKSCLTDAVPFFSGHPAMTGIPIQDYSFLRVKGDELFLKLCSCPDESYFIITELSYF